MTSDANGVSPKQLKAARALLGWNQHDLAAKANVAASTVADFERGIRTSAPNDLEAIRGALEMNGVSFLAWASVIGAKLASEQPQLSKDGAPFRLINVTDLEQWADRLDSRALFPQLISRLILATTGNSFAQLRFPSDESIQRNDWDGVCEQNATTDVPWLPTGVSGWELATQRENISTKANDDYKKRTADPRGLEQDSSTYVFVTLRSWNKSSQWAKERTADGRWKAVKALDANDFVHWIELYPAVGYWLASYLNKLPEGFVPLEKIWEEWRKATKWPLTAELVLTGRDSEAIDTLKWLRAAASVRTVEADSPDEAIAFLYATIDMLPEPHRQFFMMRCLRIFSPVNARRLAESPSPLVIVMEDSEPGLATSLAEKGHHVYMPYGSSIGVREASTILPTPPFGDFQTALRDIGIPEVEADRLSRDTFRSLVVLRRLIPSTTFVKPKWSQEPQSSLLLPCLLAGAWDANAPGDLEALKVLSGAHYEDVTRSLTGFTGAPDSPLRRAGSTWKIAAPRDVWFLLAKLITKDDLERFTVVAMSVLGSADPRFEMDPEDRWLAPVLGKLRENSPWLLSGLSDTLLLIAIWGTEIAAVSNASEYAGQVVSSLLRDPDARRWYSLSHQLRTLAEAAPEEFLSALKASLAKDESPVMALFNEDGGSPFGGANHSDLLWALEVLAWDTKYLARVALTLAILDRRDPGGRWANRPKNSLRNIFLLWKPQTHATLVQRLKVIDVLRREEPIVAWRLMLGLLPRGHESMTPNAKPRWRDSVDSADEVVTYALIAEGVDALSARLLDEAGLIADRWVQLIRALPNLANVARSELLGRLTCLACKFERDEDRMPIWAALRIFLADHRSFPDRQWAMPTEVLDQFEALYDQFRPVDKINQVAWLFSGSASIIKGHRWNDWEARDREILTLQQEAISDLAKSSGMSFLPELIEKAERPSKVGFALAQNASQMTELDPCLFSSLGDLKPAVQEFAAGLVGGLLSRFGAHWQTSILTKAREDDWPHEKLLLLLLRLPAHPEIWNVAASFGDQVRTSYWRAVHLWRPENDDDMVYACRQLLAVSRARACVHFAAGSRRKLPVQLIVEMLMQAAREPLQNSTDHNEPVMFQWSVGQLLNQLDEDPAVEGSTIAQLEWSYLRLLEHSERPPRVLHGWMSKQPAFFVEVLSAAFSPQSRTGSDEETVTEGQRRLKSQAYALIESWSTVPGLENGTLDGVALRRWVQEAHMLAVDAERGEVGDTYIGRILSRCTMEEDGIWPPVAMRDLLEELRNQTIEDGIVQGVYNNRGVTVRLPLDGGLLERAKASQYRKWEDAIELEWPQTAALLERLANNFDESAQHHDDMAERTQWTY